MRKIFRAWKFAGVSFLLLFACQHLSAQNGTIKGTVKDGNGNPLAGASVIVEGKNLGTTSDRLGNYSISMPAGQYSLVASFLGQSARRVQVAVSDGMTVVQDFTTAAWSDLNDVVVVGSRNHDMRSRITTAVPVDVIRVKDIKSFAQADVAQMLTYATPSFQSARQTISDGTEHIDPAGLRGLGPDQTLILLNGKRRHNTALVNINGTVGRGSVGTDLNAIPAAAIERIEVLRDGAAAQYGSDAIAGVINVILKKEYNGFNISGMVGQNFTNVPYNGGMNIEDGLQKQIDFAGGFAKKNGSYLQVSGQWLQRDYTNRSGYDNIPLVYLGNAGAFPATPTGIDATAYRQWLMDQDNAEIKSRGYNRRNIVSGQSASNNFTGFINAGTPVSKYVDIYLTAGMGYKLGRASAFSRNPNSMSQQPVVANGDRYYEDGFLPVIAPTIRDYSAIAGVTIKSGKWNLDISNTIGQNSIAYRVENSGNASLPANDNVQTSFNAGKLTFLQNTTNADLSRKFHFAGDDYLNIAFGAEYRYEHFSIGAGEYNSYANGQRVYQVDSIPPYPGTDKYNVITNTALAASGSQVFPGFQPTDAISAKRNIYSGYADVEWSLGNLLLDAAGRYETYREKDISYGNISGKFSARYLITPNFSVRTSVSNGFRAASLQQRYFQSTSTQFINGSPQNTFTVNNYNSIVRDAFGIKDLKPEKSTNFSVGVAGKISRNISFTLDGYYIYIRDRIVLSSAFSRSNPILAPIFNDPAYHIDASVSSVTFWTNAVNTETKGIDAVITDRFRIGNGHAVLSVAANFNKNNVVGPIHTNSVIDDPKNNPYLNGDKNSNPGNDLKTALFDRQQRSRIEIAQPASKINATFEYGFKGWDFLVRAVRWGKIAYVHNQDPYSVKEDGSYWYDVGLGTDQTFGAKITTDIVVTYKFNAGFALSLGAQNLFDVYPDKIYVDPRNELQTVYQNPVQGGNKSAGGYNAARDASNRGRFLFPVNQFGVNGRFLYARVNVEVGELLKRKP